MKDTRSCDKAVNMRGSEGGIFQVEITENQDSSKMVKRRVGKGQVVFKKTNKVWKDTSISLELNLRVQKTIMIPTALYGSDYWVLKNRDERKLLPFYMQCFRKFLSIRWYDRVWNERVRQTARVVRDARDTWRAWVKKDEYMGTAHAAHQKAYMDMEIRGSQQREIRGRADKISKNYRGMEKVPQNMRHNLTDTRRDLRQ